MREEALHSPDRIHAYIYGNADADGKPGSVGTIHLGRIYVLRHVRRSRDGSHGALVAGLVAIASCGVFYFFYFYTRKLNRQHVNGFHTVHGVWQEIERLNPIACVFSLRRMPTKDCWGKSWTPPP